jgi:hypothetical protein
MVLFLISNKLRDVSQCFPITEESATRSISRKLTGAYGFFRFCGPDGTSCGTVTRPAVPWPPIPVRLRLTNKNWVFFSFLSLEDI